MWDSMPFNVFTFLYQVEMIQSSGLGFIFFLMNLALVFNYLVVFSQLSCRKISVMSF